MPKPAVGESTAALLSTFGVAVTPIAAEWSVVLVGALIGASLHVSMWADFERWWQPLTRWVLSVLVALACTRFAAAWVIGWTPEAVLVDPDAALAAVAVLVAWGWRHALTRLGQLIGAWTPKGGK